MAMASIISAYGLPLELHHHYMLYACDVHTLSVLVGCHPYKVRLAGRARGDYQTNHKPS